MHIYQSLTSLTRLSLCLAILFYWDFIVAYYAVLSDLYLPCYILLYHVFICGPIYCLTRFLLWPTILFYQVLIMACYTESSALCCNLLCDPNKFSLWSAILLYQVLIYNLICHFIRFTFVVQYTALLSCHLWANIAVYQVLIIYLIWHSIKSSIVKFMYYPDFSISRLALRRHVLVFIWAPSKKLDSRRA